MQTHTYPSRGYTAPYFKGTLHLCSLTEEQRARTCGYWYTVTDNSMAHTAFRTRAALMRWLELRGLTLSAPVPDIGTWGVQSIVGSYRTAMHMDPEAFFALTGEVGRELSNGQYTAAIYTRDVDGIVTVHTLNPNVDSRPVYDHRLSAEMADAGA